MKRLEKTVPVRSKTAGKLRHYTVQSVYVGDTSCPPRSPTHLFQINRIMKYVADIESNRRAARAELEDERRMHHKSIR